MHVSTFLTIASVTVGTVVAQAKTLAEALASENTTLSTLNGTAGLPALPLPETDQKFNTITRSTSSSTLPLANPLYRTKHHDISTKQCGVQYVFGYARRHDGVYGHICRRWTSDIPCLEW